MLSAFYVASSPRTRIGSNHSVLDVLGLFLARSFHKPSSSTTRSLPLFWIHVLIISTTIPSRLFSASKCPSAKTGKSGSDFSEVLTKSLSGWRLFALIFTRRCHVEERMLERKINSDVKMELRWNVTIRRLENKS